MTETRPQLHARLSQPSESRALRDWIAERHYTGSAPPGYVLALEFVQSGERVGGMLLGRPAARALDSRLWLELTRMFFVDGTPHSTESQALSLMRRHVRVWGPNIKGLLAYANPAVGHEGTVYLADGWAPFGKTGKHSDAGWRNRPGRRSSPGDTASKLRFVRTP